MPAGMQVYNDDGVLQIDENTLNFVMTGKGSSTCNTLLQSGWNTYYRDIVVTGVAPMLALQGSTAVGIASVTVSGFTWTFRVVGATGAAFDYFIFDLAIGTYSTAGLQVFTAAGVLAYHTDALPMRVVDFVDRQADYTYDYTSGRSYATIQSAPGTGIYYDSGTYEQTIAASFVDDHHVHIQDFISRTGAGGGGDYYTQVWFTVIDVTNY